MKVLQEKEKKKRGKYEERIQLIGDFAPLACSVYGTLAPEAAKIMCKVRGTGGDDKEQDATTYMHRVQLQAAIIQATSLCLRSRSADEPPPVPEFPEALDDCLVGLADSGARDRL